MPEKKPSILLTGASGFIGTHLLDSIKDDYLIYALARRSQKQAMIPEHDNIKWFQTDIGNRDSLEATMKEIKKQSDIDYVIHLAAYFDFDNKDCSEYERVNVNGTKYILELVKDFGIKRFIFASSMAACDFSKNGRIITEKTPPDADFPYARSKRKGEKFVKKYSKHFPCSITRFAAVFSDFCEYVPLYMFLQTWLSKKWNSRILGGKGESAVSYIHMNDLIELLTTILEKSDKLPKFDTYVASPKGCTTHNELYEIATSYYYGRAKKPIRLPKIIAAPGIIMRYYFGKLIGKTPFEQPWTIKYIDYKLKADPSYTYKTLSWEPEPSLHVQRRLLYVIENMISNSVEFHMRNKEALRRVTFRPNFLIYETMQPIEKEIIAKIKEYMLSPSRLIIFRKYQMMDNSKLEWYIGVIYQLLMTSIKTGDNTLIKNYIKYLCDLRFDEGFACQEIQNGLKAIGRIVVEELSKRPELQILKGSLEQYIMRIIELAIAETKICFKRKEREASK